MATPRERGTAGNRPSAILRWFLVALLACGALNAFGGGYYGLSGARGVPLQWLSKSPFEDYFVPSFVLFVVVGGSLLVAAAAVCARATFARRAVTLAGAVVLTWITVQVVVIGYVSWLQPVTAIAGIVILALGSLLPRSLGLRRGAFSGSAHSTSWTWTRCGRSSRV